MSVHSSQRKKRRDSHRFKVKGMSHSEFLSRIRKTLYYGELPAADYFSLPVTEFAAELYSKVKAGRSLERLQLEEAAEISRNTCVSPCSLVLAMLYLERLKTCNPQYLDKAVPSELFIISVMVASKFLNDDGEEDEVLNSEWASSAGLGLKDVNRLEKEFLNAIRWEVFVKDTSFWSNLREMERNIALKEGKKRGWFSYSELENLLDLLDTFTLAHTLLTVSMVCLASYTAGVLTILGSTLVVSQLQSTAYLANQPVIAPGYTGSPVVNNLGIANIELPTRVNRSNDEFPVSPKLCLSSNVLCEEEIDNWSEFVFSWLGNADITAGKNDSVSDTEEFILKFPASGISPAFSFQSVTSYFSSLRRLAYFPIEIVVNK